MNRQMNGVGEDGTVIGVNTTESKEALLTRGSFSERRKGGEMGVKQITLFQCEICRTEYKFKTDAEACEKYHIKPGYPPIIAEFYKPYNQQGCGPYPVKVILQMEDGKKVEYRR